MKKTRIVVIALAILMLFAFVGCEETKSEEAFQTAGDFMNSLLTFRDFGNTYLQFQGDKINSDLSMETYEESPGNVNTLTAIIQGLAGTKDIDSSSLTIKSKKGSIIATRTDNGEILEGRMEAKDVEVEIEYKGNVNRIAFSFIFSETMSDEEKSSYRVDSFTLNGTTYKPFTCTIVTNGDLTFTSATVGGKIVDLEILNVMFHHI